MDKEFALKMSNIVGIIVGTVILTGLVVGVIFSIQITPNDALETLIGTDGYLPFVVSVSTLLLLVLGAWYTARTFEHSQKAEVASRFQKGAEMLGSEQPTTRIAGLYVLRDIVLDWREQYLATVLNTVTSLISQNDHGPKRATRFFGGPGTALPLRSDSSTLRALALIAELNPGAKRWPERSARNDGRFLVQEMFAAQLQRTGENYSGIEFRHCFFGEFWLIECDLSDSIMTGQIHDRLVLRNCNLRGTRFSFYVDNASNYVMPTRAQFQVIGGQHEGATVNGNPIAFWVR
jgi:hypothetical protein